MWTYEVELSNGKFELDNVFPDYETFAHIAAYEVLKREQATDSNVEFVAIRKFEDGELLHQWNVLNIDVPAS